MTHSLKPDESTVSLFQRHWRVYRIMVEENFLFHREAYVQLHEILAGIEAPFTFLDIGCGDAAHSALALKGTRVAAYQGIDLAPEALAFARKVLGSLHCPVSLEEGDYADALRSRTEPADVVWSGLALHHCRDDAKKAVLEDIRRILVPGGLFVFYENASPDGESRDGWLSRWDLQRPAWSAYDDADWTLMRDHVRAADFPETSSRWRQLAHETGFQAVEELFVAPTDLFRMYACR
jgi:SAM-dependent methyltransferase